jgi:hypothetical protein
MLRELLSWAWALFEVLTEEAEETAPWERGSGGGSNYRYRIAASLTGGAPRPASVGR